MPIILNQILKCLLTDGVEFIKNSDGSLLSYHKGMPHDFNKLPSFAYKTIRKVMGKPNASMEEMKAFAEKYWGGFDDAVDISENGIPSDPEYVHGYSKDYHSNGISISEAQLRVLVNIPIEDKMIADKLCLSKHTVARHCNGIYSQLGPNRTQTVKSAIEKGII